MSKTISFHSFLRGVGRSALAANVAALLARQGYAIGLVDADFLAPSLQTLFGLDNGAASPRLNDYVLGHCPIQETAHEVTSRLGREAHGRLFLIPASQDTGEIVRVLRQGYNAEFLGNGFQALIEERRLDALLIDGDAGLNKDVLILMALADVAAVVLRLDKQDYQGAAVMVEVAHRLQVPRTTLIVNQAPHLFDPEQVKTQVAQTYNCEVAGVLPYSDDVMALASSQIFTLHYPEHPLTGLLKQTAAQLLG